MDLKIPKRVHVAALGFEKDRIVEPLIKLKADELILVVMKNEKLGLKHLENLKISLKKKNIPFKIEEADLLDIVDCIRVFGRIIYNLKKEGDDVYINISGSTHISSIGASFVGMLWDAKPYHAQPKEWLEEDTRKPGEPRSKGLANVYPLQRLLFDVPEIDLISILKFIENNLEDGKIRYKKVLDYLEKQGKLKSEKAKFRSQTLIRQMHSRYLSKLVDRWGFVELVGRTRGRYIKLKENGKMYLRMFEYLVD